MRTVHLLGGLLLVAMLCSAVHAQITVNSNIGSAVNAAVSAPRFSNGYWWYQHPGGNWSYYSGNRWNAYAGANAAANFNAAVNPAIRFHNNMYWYQHPGTNQWSYYRNGRWNNYAAINANANLGARVGGAIAGAPGAALGANLGAAATAQARFHNGYWWYPGANNSWHVWNGNSWSPYSPGMRISGYGNYGANGRLNAPLLNGYGRGYGSGNFGGTVRAPGVGGAVGGAVRNSLGLRF